MNCLCAAEFVPWQDSTPDTFDEGAHKTLKVLFYFRVFSQITKQVLPGFLDNLSSQILQSQGEKFSSEKSGIMLLFCTVLRKKEK